jgi:hypothetical protein
MRKKMPAFIFMGLCLVAGMSVAADVLIKVQAGYFYPADRDFRDIYGGGMKSGLELSTAVADHVEVWLEGGYFSKTGELSFTKDKTRVRIVPLGGGMRYVFSAEKWNLYAGLGLRYHIFRESNLIGKVNAGKMGWSAHLGGRLAVGDQTLVDLCLGYSRCEMEPLALRFDVGGIEAGIGVGYRF